MSEFKYKYLANVSNNSPVRSKSSLSNKFKNVNKTSNKNYVDKIDNSCFTKKDSLISDSLSSYTINSNIKTGISNNRNNSVDFNNNYKTLFSSNILNSCNLNLQNILVHIRIRPLTNGDIITNKQNLLNTYNNKIGIDFHLLSREFAFDKVYNCDSSQEDIYNYKIKDLLFKSIEGYNLCILAYGQTGSGKTFTIGSSYLDDSKTNNENLGIIPRMCKDLFNKIESDQMLTIEENFEYVVKISFIEIYNEEIIDLLSIKTSSSKLAIKEDKKGNITINALSEHIVCDAKDCLKLLWTGSLNRKVSSTYQNDVSSRSHAIFMLNISKTNVMTKETFNFKINIVDLAGSEKLKKSKAVGDRMKEGISINFGLLILSRVIKSLSEEKKHIPYRESKLTRLLKDSLGGNSITLMIACVSPSETNIEETINTLSYASFTKNIKLLPKKNIIKEDEIESLKKEIIELKNKMKIQLDENTVVFENEKLKSLNNQLIKEVKELKKKLGIYCKNNDNNNDIQSSNNELRNTILQSIMIENDISKSTNNINDNILKEEIKFLKEKESILLDKLHHAAYIIGENGRKELVNSDFNLNEAIIQSSNLTNSNENSKDVSASVSNTLKNNEDDLQKIINFKNKEIKRLNNLLDKLTKPVLNNKLKSNININNFYENKLCLEKTLSFNIISNNNNLNLCSSMSSSIYSVNYRKTNNSNSKKKNIIFKNNVFVSYKIEKLKAFQDSLKKKILEAEVFNKKLTKEKNIIIKNTKKDLHKKDKEIKYLTKIKEDNEQMLNVNAKQISSLRNEIRKINISCEGKVFSTSKSRKNSINFEDTYKDKINNVSSCKNVKYSKAIITSNRGSKLKKLNALNKSLARPPSENNTSKELINLYSNNTSYTYDTSRNLDIKNKTNNIKNLKTPKNVNDKIKLKHSSDTDLKLSYINMIGINEQTVISNIQNQFKYLNSLLNEKNKLTNKKEDLNKEIKMYSDKTFSNKNIDYQSSSKASSSNNISKIDNEITNIKFNLKSLLLGLKSKIENALNTFEDGFDAKNNSCSITTDYVTCSKKEEDNFNNNLKNNEEDSSNKLYNLEEKLVFLELDIIYKDDRINYLEKTLKDKIDYYEEKLKTLNSKFSEYNNIAKDCKDFFSYDNDLINLINNNRHSPTKEKLLEMYSTNKTDFNSKNLSKEKNKQNSVYVNSSNTISNKKPKIPRNKY